MPPELDALLQSLEQVRLRFQGSPEWLKAPNGQPSRLSEAHWLLVRTGEFKEWFGDWERGEASGILDENGEPMVLFHGTNADFEKFRIGEPVNGRELGDGIYLATSSAVAERYGDRIMPVFCNVRHPFSRDPQRDTVWFEADAEGIAAAREFFSEKRSEWEHRGEGYERFCPELEEDAAGRIGISYALTWDREPTCLHDGIWSSGTICVAFGPEQVLSAIALTDFCKSVEPEQEFCFAPGQ